MEVKGVSQYSIKLSAHERPVVHIQFSYNGEYFFTGSEDSYIKMYCTYTCQQLEQYGIHQSQKGNTERIAIKHFCVSSDDRYIIVALNSNIIAIHDRESKNKDDYRKIPIIYRGTRFVQFSKDTKYVYVGTTSGLEGEQPAIIKYSFPEMEQVLKIEVPQDIKLNCCCLSPDDTQLWVGTNQDIRCYNTENFKELLQEDLGANVFDLTLYKNAFITVSNTDNKSVYFYSMRQLTDVYQIPVANIVNTAIVNEKNNILTIGGGLDPKLVANTKEGNNILTQHYDLIFKEIILEQQNHSAPTNRIRWSPDQRTMVSVSVDGSIAVQHYGKEFLDYQYQPEYIQLK